MTRLGQRFNNNNSADELIQCECEKIVTISKLCALRTLETASATSRDNYGFHCVAPSDMQENYFFILLLTFAMRCLYFAFTFRVIAG